MLALCVTGMLMAEEETARMDMNHGRKASYHAFINGGIGCYYMGNGNSNLKGPAVTDGLYNLTIINGARIGERFFVGVGLSFEGLMTARGKSGENTEYNGTSNLYVGFPVFVDVKWNLNKKPHKISPYIMLDLGYEAWRNDKKGTLRYEPSLLWQNCLYFNGGFGVRVGRYFDWSCTAGLRDVQMHFGVEL